MKRSIIRKSRRTAIPRSMINSNMMFINCEVSAPIDIVASGNLCRFTYASPGPLNYIDMKDVLANSSTFTEMATRFSLYKITALRIECRPVFSPYTTTSLEYPVVCVNFFPSLSGSFIGSTAVSNSDKVMTVSSQQTYVAKKWNFPNNYFEGNSSGGYGVWNSTFSYSQLPGSVQMGTYALNSVWGSTASRISNCRIIAYCVFKDKQLTG